MPGDASTMNAPAYDGQSVAIGRIVSVTGSQAVVMLDNATDHPHGKRAELGAIMKIDTPSSIILGLVSALSIPVPSQKKSEPDIRVAELELIGQLEQIRSIPVHIHMP